MPVWVRAHIRSARRCSVYLNFANLLTLGEQGGHPRQLPSHQQSPKLKVPASSCRVRSHCRYPLGETGQPEGVGWGMGILPLCHCVAVPLTGGLLGLAGIEATMTRADEAHLRASSSSQTLKRKKQSSLCP